MRVASRRHYCSAVFIYARRRLDAHDPPDTRHHRLKTSDRGVFFFFCFSSCLNSPNSPCAVLNRIPLYSQFSGKKNPPPARETSKHCPHRRRPVFLLSIGVRNRIYLPPPPRLKKQTINILIKHSEFTSSADVDDYLYTFSAKTNKTVVNIVLVRVEIMKPSPPEIFLYSIYT